MRQAIASFVKSGLDFVLPARCVVCADEMEADSREVLSISICCRCRTELAPEQASSCHRCGATLGPYAAQSAEGCLHCRRKPIRFDSALCMGMYDGILRDAILSGKWSSSATVIRSLAQLLADKRLERLKLTKADIIIPIPQHWLSRLSRSFNPASVIATVLETALSVTSDEHILRRSRATRPQKRVSVNDRYANQKESFRIRHAHMVTGKRVLLVDDVVTTGATCSEAARILKAHGAQSCHVAVLARVLDHS